MNATKKSRQFCSVCKDWLDMEVVPTGDGEDDDGVIWFRCPQCQGFLPKLSGGDSSAEDKTVAAADSHVAETAAPESEIPSPITGDEPATDKTLAEDAADFADSSPAKAVEEGDRHKAKKKDAPPEEVEPIAEYAALLARVEMDDPAPYRPWDTYEVEQCINHLAWNDCGVVVAKEELPGGRRIIKVFFSEAGVVRLIEQAPK